MMIDEAITHERESVRRNNMLIELDKLMTESHVVCMDKERREILVKFHEHLAEWLEELKIIKEMDLSIPQHFTKEQSDWIKAYCVRKNIEFYNNAIDDFVNACKENIMYKTFGLRECDIEKIAEQLKAGGENES